MINQFSEKTCRDGDQDNQLKMFLSMAPWVDIFNGSVGYNSNKSKKMSLFTPYMSLTLIPQELRCVYLAYAFLRRVWMLWMHNFHVIGQIDFFERLKEWFLLLMNLNCGTQNAKTFYSQGGDSVQGKEKGEQLRDFIFMAKSWSKIWFIN